MKKNIFDRMSDSYEQFHLKESEISVGNDTIYISPKIKLILGWSLFILCCVLFYVCIGTPFGKDKSISKEDKEAVLNEKVDVDKEHDTIVPYEKDTDQALNTFIEDYLNAVTACDTEKLHDMVADSSEYNDIESLKRKAEFITGYSNITVYTKEGLDEGSYVAFVVANLTIAGVNSTPYDIITLYIVNGARGYLINNGILSEDATAYIEKVKGDKDIQKVYKSVEKKNEELREKDSTLQQFYDIITREDINTNAVADQITEEGSSEATTTEATTTEATTTQAPQSEGQTQEEGQ